jgi:hypothetical protein
MEVLTDLLISYIKLTIGVGSGFAKASGGKLRGGQQHQYSLT